MAVLQGNGARAGCRVTGTHQPRGGVHAHQRWDRYRQGSPLDHGDRRTSRRRAYRPLAANTPAASASPIDELKQLRGHRAHRSQRRWRHRRPWRRRCWPRPVSRWCMCRGWPCNRARPGIVGGEHKSDTRDARVIAEQVRIRQDLRAMSRPPNSTSSCACWSAGAAIWSMRRPSAFPACTICWPASSPASNGAST